MSCEAAQLSPSRLMGRVMIVAPAFLPRPLLQHQGYGRIGWLLGVASQVLLCLWLVCPAMLPLDRSELHFSRLVAAHEVAGCMYSWYEV